MKKRRKVLLYSGLSILAGLGGFAFIFPRSAKFGKLPEGARLERIKNSPHYIDGEFKNLIRTPQFAEGSGFASTLIEYLLTPKERSRPERPLPAIKTDLTTLDPNRDLVVWLGHSSCYAQLGGKRILIDPVFSSHASPVFFSTRAFDTEYSYSAADIPALDCLIVSHDHWDHLDYPTIMALKPKIKTVVCGLGVGEHFERWGFAPESVHEADWFDAVSLEPGFNIHALPARHFSGRWLTRNKSLWAGFAIEAARRRIFYSGDGGYGPHFAEAGERFSGFDLAILENGQYDKSWKYIHMMPEEAAQAALDLRAQALLPVHCGRFSIANHSWDDPFIRIAAASKDKPFRLLTPVIGEMADLANPAGCQTCWWEAYR